LNDKPSGLGGIHREGLVDVGAMKSAKNKTSYQPAANKLCASCRRTCKQVANAVVAKCPRYYPFSRTQAKPEFTWKQMDLGL
jgi:hypothetical protein